MNSAKIEKMEMSVLPLTGDRATRHRNYFGKMVLLT